MELSGILLPGGSNEKVTIHRVPDCRAFKEADAGMKIGELCRKYGISDATYYQWKSKYDGMEASDLKGVRELEAENAKLKRMYAC